MAHWNTTTIRDTHRGLRYRGGKLVGFLEPGRHTLWWPAAGDRDELIDITSGVHPWTPELAHVAPARAFEALEIPYGTVAIVSVDGIPKGTLAPGRWMLWQLRSAVTATVYDTTTLHTAIPPEQWVLVPGDTLRQVTVHPYETLVVYLDGDQAGVLSEGRYGLHHAGRTLTLAKIDRREQELQIAGQEVMTADKVTLRVNLLVHFAVVDPAACLATVTNVRDALYSVAQLAARQTIAGLTLDQLLERRSEARAEMVAAVEPRVAGWGLKLVGLDLKDIVLPGEMKVILNQVITAEKQAAANVILRREETAATRSLANTAKLLEANPTLMRLKELEALKDVADRVGDVTVVTTPQALFGQLKMG